MPAEPAKMPVAAIQRSHRLDNPDTFLGTDFQEEEIQPVLDELRPTCVKVRRNSFYGNYEIGKIVRRHYEKLEKERDGHMYGERFFNRLARDLKLPGIHGPLLSTCYHLVRNYREDEYMALSQHDAITPTHVMRLAGIVDRDLRNRLIKQIIEQELTVRQLDALIWQELGPRRQAGAGRPLKAPKGLKQAFTHIDAQADKFIKMNNSIWFGGENGSFDVVRELKGLSGDQLTPQLLEQLQNVKAKYRELAVTATASLAALEAEEPELERRVNAQAEVNVAVQLAEQEESRRESERKAEKAMRRATKSKVHSLP